MIKQRESKINAYHNYLIHGMLSPGFALGDYRSREGFWFLADFVPPGEKPPRISGRLFSAEGRFMLSLEENCPVENPGQCTLQTTPAGYRVLQPGGEPLLTVTTEKFTNGFLSRIQGRLYDEVGALRMEPYFEDIRVHGDALRCLEAPFARE